MKIWRAYSYAVEMRLLGIALLIVPVALLVAVTTNWTAGAAIFAADTIWCIGNLIRVMSSLCLNSISC